MQAITRRICEAAARGIQALGVDAQFRPRNDIEVDGRKISGTGGAFDGDALMFQGTLLIQFDVEKMLRVLRIPAEKLSDKAIASARERVANLADLLGHTPEMQDVQSAMIQAFADEFGVAFETGVISSAEQARFDNALAEIDTEDWVHMLQRPQSDAPIVEAMQKFPGGLVRACVAYDRARKCIKQVWFSGDFFVSPKRAIADLEAVLRDTDVADCHRRVHEFFAVREVDLLGLQPADFVVVIQSALSRFEPQASMP
jgi:lipoate-protein ligase A